MSDFFRSGKFKILVCVFALLIGVLVYAAVSAGTANIPEMLIKTITEPFTSLANKISSSVEETIDMFVNANKYKSENEELKKQINDLHSQIMEKEKAEDENEELRKMLEIKEENDDFKFAPPAEIIARDAVDIYGGFTISKGSDDGIKLGDPVFNEMGLIGAISEISGTYSRVTTILSTDMHIGVKVASTGDIGIIENDIIYSKERLCYMSYIERDSGIAVGDIVVTAGGRSYPEGIIIGIVKEISVDDNGLSLHAVIEPAVDVFKVKNVLVLTGFRGQGELPVR